MQTSLEKLFRRYVKRGDVSALGEVFDHAAGQLMAIARQLTRDAAAAEDLVQATFLAASEGAQTFDARRPLMPWLVGILSRQARYQFRKDNRNIDVERLEPGKPRDPQQSARAMQLAVALQSAVSDLPVIYREVLLAHLGEGLKPREIARSLGRAPGTVRVQIHRGLELLRLALPAGFAVGAAMIASAPRGLAAVRTTVLARGQLEVGNGLIGVGSSGATAAWWASSLARSTATRPVLPAGPPAADFKQN